MTRGRHPNSDGVFLTQPERQRLLILPSMRMSRTSVVHTRGDWRGYSSRVVALQPWRQKPSGQLGSSQPRGHAAKGSQPTRHAVHPTARKAGQRTTSQRARSRIFRSACAHARPLVSASTSTSGGVTRGEPAAHSATAFADQINTHARYCCRAYPPPQQQREHSTEAVSGHRTHRGCTRRRACRLRKPSGRDRARASGVDDR
jgi:hypothetical protein